jgi:hypothetical protein
VSVKEQVLELLENFENKGFVLDSVEIKEDEAETERSAQMVLFVTIPIELTFGKSEEEADVGS